MTIRACILVAAAGIIAGCALTPEAEKSLVTARENYRQAQADPHVRQLAPGELAEAGRTLTLAEQLARDNTDSEWVAHQAYLAAQRARIARQTAAARAVEAELAQASAERERVLLQSRAREAESARARAEKQAAEAETARLDAIEQSRRAEEAAKERANTELSAELQRLQAQIAELQTQQTERGILLRFADNVLFDTGQAALKPGAHRALENLAGILRKQPQRQVVVEGYTDNTGNAEANQRLSEERAQAVRDALVQYGVPRNNVQTRGMGESYPVASNATAAGRQLNRRVEIMIPRLPEGSATGAGSRPPQKPLP